MLNPVAFLCHASEDKNTVRVLANALVANGVEVFFDEWEIGPGDSIRQRIDHGLGRCTHFVAVLTSTSLQKPWVNLELDAGLVRRLEGQAKFIPLRLGLPVSELPPTLKGLHSPSIGDPEKDAVDLAAFMHGVSRKPPLGVPPSPIRKAHGRIGLSPAAESIARLMVERSQQGRPMDPQCSPEAIMQLCSLGAEDMIDGADELVATGRVRKLTGLGIEYFAVVGPGEGFFPAYDPIFGQYDPREDARFIATEIVNQGRGGASCMELAAQFNWTPRRINPAVEFLALNGLVMAPGALDANWSRPIIGATHATRRYVKEQS